MAVAISDRLSLKTLREFDDKLDRHFRQPNCNRVPGYSNVILRLVVVRTGAGITAMRGSLEQFSDRLRIRNTT
jgi:hypothetical protein